MCVEYLLCFRFCPGLNRGLLLLPEAPSPGGNISCGLVGHAQPPPKALCLGANLGKLTQPQLHSVALTMVCGCDNTVGTMVTDGHQAQPGQWLILPGTFLPQPCQKTTPLHYDC